jgi:hypothetical protein
LNAPFGDGKVAISLMKKYTDFPVSAGSLPFAGSALAFHNLAGKPFTITYTIVGEIKSTYTNTNKIIIYNSLFLYYLL